MIFYISCKIINDKNFEIDALFKDGNLIRQPDTGTILSLIGR
jgi:hypothetical protein